MESSLFVYIPTYKRPAVLRGQLKALNAQKGDWPGPVRIMVNDNASPGFTESDAAALAAEYDIEVRQNAGNLQANANILLGFVFTHDDDYLWILSDNDTIRGGALKAIATEGLTGDVDVITFDTRVEEPIAVLRTWQDGWDAIGEMGLISNVIYRTEVFVDQSAEAFFYHNTGFPHLAILLATLRERGSLKLKVLPSSHVFRPAEEHGEQSGDYSVSLSGMPQLVWLLPASQRRGFCRGWLRAHGLGFVRYRNVRPEVHSATRALLIKHLWLEARVTMWMLGAVERVRPLVPKTVRQKARKRFL